MKILSVPFCILIFHIKSVGKGYDSLSPEKYSLKFSYKRSYYEKLLKSKSLKLKINLL